MEMLKNLLDQNMQTYANTELSEDEYIKDGLIHCKNCNTPRQCRISPFGTEVIVRCICNCQAEKRDEEEWVYLYEFYKAEENIAEKLNLLNTSLNSLS